MSQRSATRSRDRANDWTSYLAPVGETWRLPLDAMLLVLVLLAAFSFGATEPGSQQLVAGVAALAVVYTVIAICITSWACRPVGSWTYIPVVVFLGLIVLQTVDLPMWLAQLIADGSVEMRADLLGDPSPVLHANTISLSPAATWRQLWPLMPVVAVFLVALHAYRSTAGVQRLCTILATAGGAVALYALYRTATGAAYHLGGTGHPYSGPFLNHSHFGQFVNLGVGAALGLALMSVNRLFKKHARFADAWRELVNKSQHMPVWICLGIIVAGTLAVMLSMTRGGVLSALIAGGGIGVLLAWFGSPSKGTGGLERSGRDKAALLVGLTLLIITLSLAVGFNQIYSRMATLGDFDTAQANRSQILKDLVPAFQTFPLLGTGLGTFEVVFPGYDTDVRQSLTTHAENEYAQLMFETGGVGMACIVGFLAVIFAAFWRVARHPLRSTDYLAYGLAFGFFAILLHSLSDFGQHVPAVAIMTALTTAALLNLAALHRARPEEDDGTRETSSAKLYEYAEAAATQAPVWLRRLGPVLLILLGSATLLGAAKLEGPRKARAEFAAGQQIEQRIYGGDPELIHPGDDERMIRRYAAAAALDPSVPQYAYYRDYFTWGLIEFDDQGQPRDLTQDVDAAQAIDELIEQINGSRVAAPSYGPHQRLLGEVLFFGPGNDDDGAALISRGQRLSPHDPYAAFSLAYVDATRGEMDRALASFARATELSPALKRDVVDVLVNEFSASHDAYRFAQGDQKALRYLQGCLASKPEETELLAQTTHDLRALVQQRAYADHPQPADQAAMARIHVEEGNDREAIRLYRQAIARAPREVSWRLELARLFANIGQPENSLREARAVLQLRPASAAANDLLREQVIQLGGNDPAEPRL